MGDLFGAARTYQETYGNLKIPAGYVTEEGIALGNWLHCLKHGKSGNKSRVEILTEEQKAQLEALGMEWEKEGTILWNQKFILAKAYYEQNGNLDMPVSYCVEGIRLGRWISNIVKGKKTYYMKQVNRKEKSCIPRMIVNTFRSAQIYIKEKPDVVICTGVLAMIPICLMAKIAGKKLIYIESFAKVISIDFYIVGNRIHFGEITFTNGAGFDRFSSYEFDLMMGDWLKLDQ